MTRRAAVRRSLDVFLWMMALGGMRFLYPVEKLFYLSRGLSLNDLFLVWVTWTSTVLVFEVPAGFLADRLGYRRSFLIGSLLHALAYVFFYAAESPADVYAGLMVSGLGMTFYSGAGEAFVYESLIELGEKETMSAVWGRMMAAKVFTLVPASLLGGYLANDSDPAGFQVLLAGTFIVLLVQAMLTFLLVEPQRVERLAARSIWRWDHVQAGLDNLRREPALLRLFLNGSFVFTAFIVLEFITQPALRSSGLNVAGLGYVFAATCLLQWACLRATGSLERRFTRRTLFHVLGGVLVAGIAAAAAGLGWALGFAVLYIMLSGLMKIRLALQSHMQNDLIPTGSRATTISMLSMLDCLLNVAVASALHFKVAENPVAILTVAAACGAVGLCFPARDARRRRDEGAIGGTPLAEEPKI